MKLEDVRARLEQIRGYAEEDGDSESAHIYEDVLHLEVLRHFAAHAPSPFRELAAEAMKSGELDFERWCA